MTADEAREIHQRLDRQDEKLDRIMEAVAVQVTTCSAARHRLAQIEETVYGNGRDGLVREVQQLQTVRQIGSRGFWALVGLVASLVSGAILALGSAVLAWVRQ